MANPQNWRSNLAKAKKLTDVSSTTLENGTQHNNPVISSHAESRSVEEQPRTKKRLSSFTALLNHHHRTPIASGHGTTFLPHLDWSSHQDQERACEANTELMCNAVRQQLLTHPSEDLPASFNSALLHIIEAYSQLLEHCGRQWLEVKGQVTQDRHEIHGMDVNCKGDPIGTYSIRSGMLHPGSQHINSGHDKQIASSMTNRVTPYLHREARLLHPTVIVRQDFSQVSESSGGITGSVQAIRTHCDRNVICQIEREKPPPTDSLSSATASQAHGDNHNGVEASYWMTAPIKAQNKGQRRALSFIPGDDDNSLHPLHQHARSGTTRQLHERTGEECSSSRLPFKFASSCSDMATINCEGDSRPSSITTIDDYRPSSTHVLGTGHVKIESTSRSTKDFAIAAARAAEHINASGNKSIS